MSRSDLSTFQAAHPAATNTQKAQDALDIAGDLVQEWAPPPDPEPDDYDGRAQRAERALAAWIYDTVGYRGGYTRGLDVLRRGENFDAKGEGLRAIVRGLMGSYYTGGGANVAYISRAPW